MRHRADDKKVKWLEDLAFDEIKGGKKVASDEQFVALQTGDHSPFGESFIDKLAAEDLSNMSMEEIEKKIDSASSIEELNALEDQIKAMDSSSQQPQQDSNQQLVTNEQQPAAPTDPTSIQKDVQEIKTMLNDKNTKTQNQLLDEIRKLNQSMGADKQIDLNQTFEQ